MLKQWSAPIRLLTALQLDARARRAHLSAVQNAALIDAFRHKLAEMLRRQPPAEALARIYARFFTPAELDSLTQYARKGTPIEPMVLFPRFLQLRLQIATNWMLERSYQAMQDAMASFPQMENEPAGGRPGKLAPPRQVEVDIYPPPEAARAELAAALAQARSGHKRVLLDFGGNWCYDCHVLEQAFNQSEVTPFLRAHFLVVHINIGQYNRNLDLAARYHVPLQPGVPALAVLSSQGRLLYSQGHGEFENARALAPAEVAAFLRHWAAAKPHE